jgi:hypothetical protein
MCYNTDYKRYFAVERWTNFMHIINVVRRGSNRKGMIKMKRRSLQKSKSALTNAKASLAIEGIYLTSQEDQLLQQRASGRLKNSEFLARAIEIANNV